MRARWSVFVVIVVASLAAVIAGCSSGNSPSTHAAMMGDSVAAMMGVPPGYHYSRLTCSAPSSLPGSRVQVMLADMGMMQMMGGTAPLGVRMMLHAVPARVAAGPVSLVAYNMGWRTHELVVLPLTAGAAAGRRVPGADGKVSESSSLGEASRSCAAGAGDGNDAGSVGWTTVSLAPGTYELVCNLPNHYADGMHQELVVT
jgi:uncharacterized cupredoxin-like copper-binding protein